MFDKMKTTVQELLEQKTMLEFVLREMERRGDTHLPQYEQTKEIIALLNNPEELTRRFEAMTAKDGYVHFTPDAAEYLRKKTIRGQQ
jgi:uncharacterized protein YdeI (YjbR/CyaY-like superfamily)